MSSEDPPEMPWDDKSTPLDLETVFADPAGLRVARAITKPFVVNYLRRQFTMNSRPPVPARQNSFSSSPNTPLTFDSSPEVTQLLQEILAFSDQASQTPRHPEVAAAMFTNQAMDHESREGARYSNPAASLVPKHLPSEPQAPAHNHPPRMHTSSHTYKNGKNHNSTGWTVSSSLMSIASQSRFPGMPSSAMEFDLTSSAPPSTTHGTESPYTVESPSRQPSPIDLAASSGRRPSMVEAQPYGLGKFEGQNTMSRPLHSGSSRTDQNRDRTMDVDLFPRLYSLSQGASDRQNITNHLYSRASPLIKGFLPVNKQVDPKHRPSPTKPQIMQRSPAFNHVNNQPKIIELDASPAPEAPPPDNLQPLHSPSLSPSVTPGPIDSMPKQGSEAPEQEKKARKKRKAMVDDDGNPVVKKKRKVQTDEDGNPVVRKKRAAKTDEDGKPPAKRAKKEKEKKKQGGASNELVPSAKENVSDDLWMRILEFTPPSFLKKARLISKKFKGIIDRFESIYINQRIENFGAGMPSAPFGLTERQYNDLLGGKGCMEKGCQDKKTSRTHWSWHKRWCWECWKVKIEREDRVLKLRQNQYGRGTLVQMLECIPIGMHDSFLKPHDYVEDVESRSRGAPRLYRYYLTDDVASIVKAYEELTPVPHKDDPSKTPEENAAAQANYNEAMLKLAQTQTDFLAERKAKNDKHMEIVQKIEGAIRKRREDNAKPYDDNRKARRELFLKRAKEDIPEIDEEFIKNTKAFKAATRIFRDAGSERGWLTLKPKIEKEWEERPQPEQGNEATTAGSSINKEAEGSRTGESKNDDNDSLGLSLGLESLSGGQLSNEQVSNEQHNSLLGQRQLSNSQLMGQLGNGQFNSGSMNLGDLESLNSMQFNILSNGNNNGALGSNFSMMSQAANFSSGQFRRMNSQMTPSFQQQVPPNLQAQIQQQQQRVRQRMVDELSNGRTYMDGQSTSMLGSSTLLNQLSGNYGSSMAGRQAGIQAQTFQTNTWGGNDSLGFFQDQTTGSSMSFAYPSNTMTMGMAMPQPLSVPRPRITTLNSFTSSMNDFQPDSATSNKPDGKITVSSLLSDAGSAPAQFNSNPFAQ